MLTLDEIAGEIDSLADEEAECLLDTETDPVAVREKPVGLAVFVGD